MVYTAIYTCFYGIYRDIYNPHCTYMVCLLPFQVPGGHPTQTRKFVFPTVSEDGETQESQASRDNMSDWSARDGEDYNYAPQAGSAGSGEGAGRRDPLAELCDSLPGLEAADIAASLRDLPKSNTGQCSRNDG